MLAVLFVWTNATLIFSASGLLYFRFYNKYISNQNKSVTSNISSDSESENFLPDIDILLLSGMAITATLCAYISLIFPINTFLNGILSLISLLVLFLYRKDMYFLLREVKIDFRTRSERLAGVLSFIILILVLILSVAAPLHYDTGLYHIQFIKWTHTFPAVPGLGNLLNQLAANNHFFVVSSLFTYDEILSFPLFPLNSFLILLLSIRILYNTKHFIINKDYFSLLFDLIFISLYFSYDLSMAQSTSPDTTVAIFVYYAIFIILRIIRKIPHNLNNNPASILFIFFLPVIKLSALPSIILSPLLFSFRDRRKLILTAVIGLIFAVPYVLRNIILSGYVLYPLAGIDLFQFDWKIPSQHVRKFVEVTRNWAIFPGPDFIHAGSMRFYEWIPRWWSSKNTIIKLVILFNFFTPFIAIRRFWQKDLQEGYFTSALFLWILFWFLAAPDPRFAYGVLFSNFAYLLIIFTEGLGEKYHRFFLRITAILTLPLFLRIIIIPFFIHVAVQPEFSEKNSTYIKIKGILFHVPTNSYLKERLFLPSTHTAIAIKKIELPGITINMPVEGDQCYNAALPCSHVLPVEIVQRGINLPEGFKSRQQKK